MARRVPWGVQHDHAAVAELVGLVPDVILATGRPLCPLLGPAQVDDATQALNSREEANASNFDFARGLAVHWPVRSPHAGACRGGDVAHASRLRHAAGAGPGQ